MIDGIDSGLGVVIGTLATKEQRILFLMESVLYHLEFVR